MSDLDYLYSLYPNQEIPDKPTISQPTRDRYANSYTATPYHLSSTAQFAGDIAKESIQSIPAELRGLYELIKRYARPQGYLNLASDLGQSDPKNVAAGALDTGLWLTMPPVAASKMAGEEMAEARNAGLSWPKAAIYPLANHPFIGGMLAAGPVAKVHKWGKSPSRTYRFGGQLTNDGPRAELGRPALTGEQSAIPTVDKPALNMRPLTNYEDLFSDLTSRRYK